MTKRAERPVTIAFTSNYRQNDPDFTCTFDSNRFIEWEIQPLDMPIGQVIFKSEPIEDNGYTELARVKFDYCDHGLYVYQELANMLYEAQHPWLDYADAVEKGAFDNEKAQDVECLCGFIMKEGLNWSAPIGSFEISNIIKEAYEMKEDDFTVAFKPVKSLDFYYFNEVKVWQPPQ